MMSSDNYIDDDDVVHRKIQYRNFICITLSMWYYLLYIIIILFLWADAYSLLFDA